MECAKSEVRFVPNPDYPPDWEERQIARYGDCFGCANHFELCAFCSGKCKKTGRPLTYPIRNCCARVDAFKEMARKYAEIT